MHILLNGQVTKITSNKLEQITKQFNGHIAVSINGQVVSKTMWQEFLLKDNDKVEIIELVGGG